VAALKFEYSNAELFPELPKPLPPLKARKPKAKPKATVAPVALQPSVTAGLTDTEASAQALDAHPDYRVLRRLQPRLEWPAAQGGADVVRVVVLDTETTGLDASKDKIIELALLRVDVDRVTGIPVGPVQVFDELEDPGMPIPKEARDITGITDADVAGKRLDEARIAALLDGVDVVIAHNAGFDRPFCEARMPLFRHFAWACSFADLDWKAQGRGSSKLEALAQAMGLFYDAHRAEMDCHALLAVLVAPLPNEPSTTGMAKLLHAVQTPFSACKPPAHRLRPKTCSKPAPTDGTPTSASGTPAWPTKQRWKPSAPGSKRRSMAHAMPV